MVTQAEIQAHRASVDDVVALATAELVAEWPGLPLDAPEQMRGVLADLLDSLTQDYAALAASIGADWYDELRAAEDIPGVFEAVMPDLPSPEQIQASASYAASALYVDTDKALADMATIVDRTVANADRSSIEASTVADPAEPRWARSARVGACAFCALMSSRGPVYRSEASAGGGEADENDYHEDCYCVAVPVWDRRSYELPEQAGDWSNIYGKARAEVGRGASLSEILAAMRTIGGLR